MTWGKNIAMQVSGLTEKENAKLKAALQEIADLGHYPDSTIALRALGKPVTEPGGMTKTPLNANS